MPRGAAMSTICVHTSPRSRCSAASVSFARSAREPAPCGRQPEPWDAIPQSAERKRSPESMIAIHRDA